MLTPTWTCFSSRFSFYNRPSFTFINGLPFVWNIFPPLSILRVTNPHRCEVRKTSPARPGWDDRHVLRSLRSFESGLWWSLLKVSLPQVWALCLTQHFLQRPAEGGGVPEYSKCSIALVALILTSNLHKDLNELSVVSFDVNYLILRWIQMKSDTKPEWKLRDSPILVACTQGLLNTRPLSQEHMDFSPLSATQCMCDLKLLKSS